MNHPNNYYLVSAIVFLFLGMTWSQKDWQNTLAKLVLYLLAIWGGLLSAIHSGYIIRR